jgi:membrane-associated phospholipid phosphatase
LHRALAKAPGANRISSQAADNARRKSAALVAAAIAFALFIALGYYVSHHPEPVALVALEAAWVNHGTLIAWWATWLCLPQFLVPLCVVLLLVAWRAPAWRSQILFSLAALVVCWLSADLFQRFFERPRRLDWVVKHETSFSYPSSHAAMATGFYLQWAVVLLRSRLPAGLVGGAAVGLVALVALVVMWSRLALGAHYLTDIAGGALLGAAIVCAGAGVLRR